jgi:hypothetical protein
VKSIRLPSTLIKLGFTSILLGYFLVWLPHKAVGLSFIGLEMGEWTKFLPGVQQGQYLADRNLFYLPPIALSLMLICWTIGWSSKNWKSWAMRAMAVLIGLLAFPPIESILDEPVDQWLPRLSFVLLVLLATGLVSLGERMPKRHQFVVKWSIMTVLGLAAAILPLWTYLSYRNEIASLFGSDIGIGPGLWLNTIGSLLIAAAACYQLFAALKSLTAITEAA